jgi:hypothetical protein
MVRGRGGAVGYPEDDTPLVRSCELSEASPCSALLLLPWFVVAICVVLFFEPTGRPGLPGWNGRPRGLRKVVMNVSLLVWHADLRTELLVVSGARPMLPRPPVAGQHFRV